MPITATNPFKGRHYPGEVILSAVRWYLRYPLAYLHVSELLAERGLFVDASCVWGWGQAYAPEINRRCRRYLKPTNRSYRVDETYIKVKGQDRYLYRAVDSTGQTIDFLFTAKRDKASAKRFFQKALRGSANVMPRVSNLDKNPAYPAGSLPGVKDGRGAVPPLSPAPVPIFKQHRGTRSPERKTENETGHGLWLLSHGLATIPGIETMHLIGKGRVRRVPKDDVATQIRFLHRLFGLPTELNQA